MSIEISAPVELVAGVNSEIHQFLGLAKEKGVFSELDERRQSLINSYYYSDASTNSLRDLAGVKSKKGVNWLIRTGMEMVWAMVPHLQDQFPRDRVVKLKDTRSEAYRQKRGREMVQRWEDPEYRGALSNTHKAFWADPSNHLAMSQANVKTWERQEYRSAITLARQNTWADPNYREAKSSSMIRMWKNSLYREQVVFRQIRSGQDAYSKLVVLNEVSDRPDIILERYGASGLIGFGLVNTEAGVLSPTDTRRNLNDRLRRAKKAFDQVIIDNQRFVNIIASTFLREDREFQDIVSSAQENLLKAAARYDPSFGYSFSRYARDYIRGGIIDELAKGSEVGKKTYKKIRKIEEAENEVFVSTGRKPLNQEITQKTGLTTRQIADARLIDSRRNLSLEKAKELQTDRDGSDREPEYWEADLDEYGDVLDSLEKDRLLTMVDEAASKLPEKVRELLDLRYREGLEIKDVLTRLGISRTHYFRLHNSAIQKLKDECQAA